MKYKTGLLIGRFQPFHKGHLYLLKKALKHVQTLIVGIGSSNISNGDNPFSFGQRKKMLEKIIEHERIKERIGNIIPIPDDPSDDIWLGNVLKTVGEFDIYIGNDEWTDGIFENAGYKVLRIPYFRRELYEGKKIRPLLIKNAKWQTRVPSYLVSSIGSHIFHD